MILIEGLAIRVFTVGVLMLPAAQNETGNLKISGQWSLTSSQAPDRVQLMLHWKSGKHSFNSTMEWLLNRIDGLATEQLKSPGAAVKFQIRREAGTLSCDGFLRNGSGGGVFTFAANRSFVDGMSAFGFSGLREDQVFGLAVHDVTTSYVKTIRAEGISLAGADQLIAMKIHEVEPQYVREMKSVGFSDLSADELIAMRIHGVSIEFVRQLDKLGYKHPSIDHMVAMRIHRVTPELIQKLQQRGLKDLSIDNLISLPSSQRCELSAADAARAVNKVARESAFGASLTLTGTTRLRRQLQIRAVEHAVIVQPESTWTALHQARRTGTK